MTRHTPPAGFATVPGLPGPPFAVQRRAVQDYRPYRKLRHIAEDLGAAPADTWMFVKSVRRLYWQEIPVPRVEGGQFGIAWTPQLIRSLFLVDRASGDDILSSAADGPLRHPLRKRLDAIFKGGELIPTRVQVRRAMSEAAESSIIEGASGTRREAIELLRSGRIPKTESEKMIFNNYQAMQLVKRRMREPLSIELLLELQGLLTDSTIDAALSGRLRTSGDNVRVVDTRSNEVIFVPPPAELLRPLLTSVCDFANRGAGDSDFIHPIVSAAILHFLIGYTHPFVDGNGRTARAVFYWQALRHGYGLFEYLSISEIIREGYARYPQAYLDSESDDGDLTYFVLYHLDVIEQALGRLADDLRREEEKIIRSEQLLRLSTALNLRQRLLLDHALRHTGAVYTVKSHMNSNGVSINTSRADLEDLVRRKLMTTSKRGKEVVYMAIPTLAERVARRTEKPR